MYRHIKNYELRYTDVDAYDRLKLSSLLSFLEESSCLSADELGFGYKDVSPKKLGFVITNWYLKLDKPILLGDVLTVHTWPIKPKKCIFLRDYEIYINGVKTGVATARWCMINTETYALTPSSAFFRESDVENYNTERSVVFTDWKIPVLQDKAELYSKTILYSDYDHNFHVNNTRYADFLLDVFSVDEMKNRIIDSVQITYVKQCKETEKLTFFLGNSDGYYYVEGRVGCELRVQLRIKFNEL